MIDAVTFTEQTGLVSVWGSEPKIGSRKLSPKLHLVQVSGAETACGRFKFEGDNPADHLPTPPVTKKKICGICLAYWRARNSVLTAEILAAHANAALGYREDEEGTG